jgi:hypothetical protein
VQLEVRLQTTAGHCLLLLKTATAGIVLPLAILTAAAYTTTSTNTAKAVICCISCIAEEHSFLCDCKHTAVSSALQTAAAGVPGSRPHEVYAPSVSQPSSVHNTDVIQQHSYMLWHW